MWGLFRGPGPAQSTHLSKQNLTSSGFMWATSPDLVTEPVLIKCYFESNGGISHIWRLLLIRLLSHIFDFEPGYHKMHHSLHCTEICLSITLTLLCYLCPLEMSTVTLIPSQITPMSNLSKDSYQITPFFNSLIPQIFLQI